MSKDEKYKILFVCLGNICRSPAAEGIMRRLVEERGLAERVEIDSAGLSGYHAGDLPDRRMRVHARRRGLKLTHRSRPVSSSDFERFDMIVAMDDSNYDCLRDMAGTLEEEAKSRAHRFVFPSLHNPRLRPRSILRRRRRIRKRAESVGRRLRRHNQ